MRRLLTAAMISAALTGAAVADSFQLYAASPGPDQPLGITSGGDLDGLVITKRGKGATWSTARDGKHVRIKTTFKGAEVCLDVVRGGTFKDYARVIQCADYAEERWTISGSGTALRLTNAAVPGKCLQVLDDGRAKLSACSNVPQQTWGRK